MVWLIHPSHSQEKFVSKLQNFSSVMTRPASTGSAYLILKGPSTSLGQHRIVPILFFVGRYFTSNTGTDHLWTTTDRSQTCAGPSMSRSIVDDHQWSRLMPASFLFYFVLFPVFKLFFNALGGLLCSYYL